MPVYTNCDLHHFELVCNENAGDKLWNMALDPEEYPELNDYAKEGLEWALKKIAQNGITSAVMPELTGFQGDIIKHGKI